MSASKTITQIKVGNEIFNAGYSNIARKWVESGVETGVLRHLHIDSLEDLSYYRFSYNSSNTYFFTVDNLIPQEGTPNVYYYDLCYIKPLGVVYTHGQFYCEAIADFDGYAYSGSVYGVQWDTSNQSPECTRIGNLALHATLPVQSQIVGGVMTDDGTFTPFSNQADWTSEIRDGSTGQVMVKLPQFYAKFETVGTINRVLFSHLPVLGFITIPEMYISAYQATIDRTNNKLASVRNFTAQYRGGNNQSAWDNEDTAGYDGESHRSVLDRPASNKSLTDFRNLARNRNNGDTRWNCMMYEVQRALYWLYVVEYATLNTQKAYNAELSTEGYRQGGLGDGVSNWNNNAWNSFNGYYGFVPCGWTDEFGNQTGVKNYTVYNASGTELLTTSVPRYRGIENPFGHLWQWTDGILVDCQSASSGGLSPVYICTDPSKFSSSSYGDYQFVANEFRTNNYVKTVAFGENGDIIGTVAQSSSSSYYCDYHYISIPSSGTSLRGVRFGGSANSGAGCGFVYSNSDNVPSDSGPSVGSRLCFKP